MISEIDIKDMAEQPVPTQQECYVKTIRYDLSPAMIESEIRNKLIELGWTPPEQPTQRTWVGLTDEEVLIMSRYDLEYAALIGEVQRKLKEKNSDF